MRIDVYVPNESDGFVFTSVAMRGRGISPGDRGWTKAVADCELLPLSVESEDAANVRVVVDEPLDAAENSEWVGVVRSALRVLADYFGANSLQRTGAELALRKRDPALFAYVVARVFWSRYAAIWPLQDEDAPAS